MDALATHKIQRQNNLIEWFSQKPDGVNTANLFAVKNWTFNGNGTYINDRYKYINTIPNGGFDPMYEDRTDPNNIFWRYQWGDTVEVTDGDGIPGQNTANPLATFGSHVVALIDGTYYDASYGQTYARDAATDTGVNSFLTTALAGFVKVVQADRPNNNKFAYVFQKAAGLVGTTYIDEKKTTYPSP